jgi:hypothetical protein
MNMNFQRQDVAEIAYLPLGKRSGRQPGIEHQTNSSKQGLVGGLIVAAIALIGLLYLGTQISVTALLIIAGVGLGIGGLATAACIYAFNQTPVGF